MRRETGWQVSILQPIRPLASFLVLVVALFGYAGGASAMSISLDDCDSQGCQGVTLSLEVEDNDDSYHVTLTIDADDYTGNRLGLNQVGFKAISNWTGVTLDLYPDPDSDPLTDPWQLPAENQAAVVSSNALCEKGTSSDKVCAFGFVDISEGGEFTWEFTLVGSTLLDPSDWSIGGQFANGPGPARGQIISAAIPEPTAALVFALGFGIVSRAVRRKA